MAKHISSDSFFEKIGISVIAQAISLIISFILNLIVPKFISEYSYSCWQTYLLYIGYVGLLHFGLLDGILLRYSQYDYDKLDKSILRSQYQLLVVLNVVFAIVFLIISFFLKSSFESAIMILIGIGIITKNGFYYTLYIFQMTNRIKGYAVLSIMQRIAYGGISVILILFKIDNFVWFCIADLIGDSIGIFFGIVSSRDLYLGKISDTKKVIKDFKMNISAGIKLMIANWSATMIVGFAKTIIQYKWGVFVFGKISFSFSLTNLFLSFIAASAIVLFPSLKRMEPDCLPVLYARIRNMLTPSLIIIMSLYFPVCGILNRWLPNYAESLSYLGLLLPMIIFSAKTTLLTDNYLKAYRKENDLLYINLGSIVFAFTGFLFFSFVFDSIDGMILWVVASIALRFIVSEHRVGKIIEKFYPKENLLDMIWAFLFVICARNLSLIYGFILYSMSLFFYVPVANLLTKKHSIAH